MRKLHILLLEPDLVLGKDICQAASLRGWRVAHAYTAQDALNRADQMRPDLVICELQLIEHSGIEFLYEFRSYTDWNDIPVIIFSVVPPSEFSGNVQGLRDNLGIVSYLYKPHISLNQLLQTAADVTQAERHETAHH